MTALVEDHAPKPTLKSTQATGKWTGKDNEERENGKYQELGLSSMKNNETRDIVT